ncbi:MAG: stage II sporulation protein P [Epulopiscium sp.]|jgi:stage II sporulation protein P|nr:stage II sporulation protein P [Candidatus Epulonipiscium sp.]
MTRGQKKGRKKIVEQNLLGLLLVAGFFSCFGGDTGRRIVLSETVPFYSLETSGQYGFKAFHTMAEFPQDSESSEDDIIGIDDVTYQPELESVPIGKDFTLDNLSEDVLQQLENFDYLKSKFYLVDARTQLRPEDMNVREYLQKDFTLDYSMKGPKVLLMHTHSMEGFLDSGDTVVDMKEGIWGAGEYLKELLEKKYGIEVLHDTGRYDMVDGKGQRIGAYERMEGPIAKILEENPSIQVVIDLHRDGLPENIHLVTQVNGKPCARVMFFNGLCRLAENGVGTDIPDLKNPYIKDNLAFSLQMKVALNSKYPDFTRKTYLNAYRYSLHMKPRSLLIEVGSQMNTKEEAWNAMEPLAEALAEILK